MSTEHIAHELSMSASAAEIGMLPLGEPETALEQLVQDSQHTEETNNSDENEAKMPQTDIESVAHDEDDAINWRYMGNSSGPLPPARSLLPVILEFRNLEFKVPIGSGVKQMVAKSKAQWKPVIRGVSGILRPGELVAVIGPSGSGKSSLLNILSGRIPANTNFSGQVLVNGKPLDSHFMKHNLAYVLQDDFLLPNQTVRECLEFSAKLRLPEKMSDDEKGKRVDEVIADLGLRKVQNSKIGGGFVRGISGGERKRVSIGLEFVRDVSVILADEPTTGLDSTVALHVVDSLRMLAKKHNMTVVCTIHQPRSQIWDMFDKVMVLSEGRSMYFGTANELPSFLSNAGLDVPEFVNPADLILDLVAVDYRNPEVERESKVRVESVGNYFDKVKDKYVTYGLTEDEKYHIASYEANFESKGFAGTSFFYQFLVLLKRTWVERSRDFGTLVIKPVLSIFFALLFGGIYFGLGLTQADIQNRVGILFFALMQQAFSNMMPLMIRIISEKLIFHRENRAGYYGTTPYFLARNIGELPFIFPGLILYGTILYWMAGLQAKASKFFIFLGVLALDVAAAESLGMTIGYIAPNFGLAQIMAPVALLLFVLVAGLYANISTLSPFFEFLGDISFLRYGYSALTTNEFTGLTFECDTGSSCNLQTGEQVLDFLSIDASIPKNVLLLFAVIVGLRCLAYISLKLSKPRLVKLSRH
jgi:ABC-type multidrug transport system ATPase subunit